MATNIFRVCSNIGSRSDSKANPVSFVFRVVPFTIVSDILADILQAVCGTTEKLISLPLRWLRQKGLKKALDCSKLEINSTVLCEKPVELKLPSALNLGKVLSTFFSRKFIRYIK